MYENLLANVPTDLWIGGQWRKASDNERFDVIDPATEKTIASVASASVDDARAAVDAASGAFPAWAAKKPRERAEILRRSFELIMRDAERLAKLITIENGKALSDSRGEVAYAAEFFRWYAEEAVRNIGDLYRAPASGARIVVEHRPAGVAVLITPWNFPAAMATRKIAPALAAGCTVVLKPASDTPLTMLALMPILEEAGVPAGVVNVIPSRRSGPVVEAMLHDMRVRVLSFTGSTETGRRLLHRLPTISSSRRWSSAAMRRSSCSRMPTSMRRSRAPWSPRCAIWARPARRPTASMCMRRSMTNSPRS